MYILDGYIVSVSASDAQYAAIVSELSARPVPPDGYDYRLRADTLEWELVELPPAPDPEEQDIPAEEALKIIAGGEPDDV